MYVQELNKKIVLKREKNTWNLKICVYHHYLSVGDIMISIDSLRLIHTCIIVICSLIH